MRFKITKRTWGFRDIETGWGNGYVFLPKGHRFYGIDYDEINQHVEVHRGLTYSREDDDGFWVVGFDTAHFGDNKDNWNRSRVLKETLKLRDQLIKLSFSEN